jgi:hypothetical protein
VNGQWKETKVLSGGTVCAYSIVYAMFGEYVLPIWLSPVFVA